MRKQCYAEEFKTEAVKQIAEQGHEVADVSARFCVSKHRPYQWTEAKQMLPDQPQAHSSQADERHHLKVELKRVTDERDI